MEIKCSFCQKVFDFKGGPAHYARNKTHACSRFCQNAKHGRSRKRNKDKQYSIWMNVKKRAKHRGIDFNLKWEDIPEIPEFCPILDIEIKANTKSAPLDSSPSLDRIDPKLGYVPGNIRIISNRANRIKSDATLDELKLILKDATIYEDIQSKTKRTRS